MRMNVREKVAGSTYKATWVSSGGIPNPITSSLIDKNKTVVSSISAVASGNGAFYALHPVPNTPGWYVNEWRALAGGFQYVNRQLLHVINEDVD